MKQPKQAIVLHSGGMDSSICLALAIRDFGRENVLSLSFCYHQRHSPELIQAQQICRAWNVDHKELDLEFLAQITDNALTNPQLTIQHLENQPPNSLVIGRNGLMAQIAGIQAHQLGARRLYLGVIELDSANSGYRDCSRVYMDLVQSLLKIDLAEPDFEIRTPLINMSKKETLIWAHKLGILEYLLQETITCYEGLPHYGCQICPACRLRNEGLRQFLVENPDFNPGYPTMENL